MAQVSVSEHIEAAAADVWNIVGNFNGLPGWVPIIESSDVKGDGIGAIRTLSLADGGGTVKERLETYDEGRSYSYSIVEGGLPVRDYIAIVMLTPDGPAACNVTWSSSFEPDGANEDEAVDMIDGLYELGLSVLKDLFED